MLASKNFKRECSKVYKSHVSYCSKINILIIVLSMPKGPALWKRLVTGHVRVNDYLMKTDGYPNLIVELVSRAMLKHPAE